MEVVSGAGDIGDGSGWNVTVDLGVIKGVAKLDVCCPDTQEDNSKQNISVHLR